MAILKIARMGHPVLGVPAAPVADPQSPEIRALLADMVDTLADIGGIGLAAPQVHQSVRMVIFHVPAVRAAAERYRDSGLDETQAEVPFTVLINPEIEPLSEETAEGWESCLSVPGMMGSVPRFTRIRYTGLSHEGEVISREAEGFHARVVQHECDHLDGILYPQRITDMSQFGFTEEMKRRAQPDTMASDEPDTGDSGT
ncbi:MAG: peptide deformylase [Rhodospirillales bacterium]|nr:peptide deformylase [Rhodospirillales bacterium]